MFKQFPILLCVCGLYSDNVDTTAIIDLLLNKTNLFTIQHGKESPAAQAQELL